MVERLLKAYDSLKAAPADASQDTLAKKKERLAACTFLCESVCVPVTRFGDNNDEPCNR